MREKLSRSHKNFRRIFLKLHFANSKIIFDLKSFPFPEQFGGNKARSGEVIARRNEFQDKFFLVHSTCRWRDCARASVVGSFSILFTFSRQRDRISDLRISLSGNTLRGIIHSVGRTRNSRRVRRAILYSAVRIFRICP